MLGSVAYIHTAVPESAIYIADLNIDPKPYSNYVYVGYPEFTGTNSRVSYCPACSLAFFGHDVMIFMCIANLDTCHAHINCEAVSDDPWFNPQA